MKFVKRAIDCHGTSTDFIYLLHKSYNTRSSQTSSASGYCLTNSPHYLTVIIRYVKRKIILKYFLAVTDISETYMYIIEN